jgi:hypothetical protein
LRLLEQERECSEDGVGKRREQDTFEQERECSEDGVGKRREQDTFDDEQGKLE